ncbi:uncharacterized protein LOC125947370 [Dermacentor silvarum]|uniref:uncharacterized protein LOC125947370 n=1 Tax=Dermacentor silvarum TaxID=543639 RepID=UPI00210183C3|nr:uncharacterized protein LOC125947370 [Dermacentor silvarum]
MPVSAVLLSVSFLFNAISGDTEVPPNNALIDKVHAYPDYETYQDVYRCIPFNERWFVVYRNKHEKDEIFDPSDDGMCAHMMTDMQFVDDRINVSIADTNGRKNFVFELQTYEGRSTATGFKVTPAEDPNAEHGLTLRALYADCMHCIIFNLEYMDMYACNMLVPDSDARASRIAGHCEHIYNMLCGTDKKWIYECCEKKSFMYQFM